MYLGARSSCSIPQQAVSSPRVQRTSNHSTPCGAMAERKPRSFLQGSKSARTRSHRLRTRKRLRKRKVKVPPSLSVAVWPSALGNLDIGGPVKKARRMSRGGINDHPGEGIADRLAAGFPFEHLVET